MKLFIINLKRRNDKLDKILDRLKEYKTLDIEVFNAIDGSQIDQIYLDKNGYKVCEYWSDPITRRQIKSGEIGCALSHYNVWKIIKERNLEMALIVEDDATFEENFIEKLETCIRIKDEYDIFYLGRKVFNKVEKVVRDDIVVPNFSYWCIGYILTQSGANKLIDTNYQQSIIPVDEFIPFMYSSHKITYIADFINTNGKMEQLIAYAFRENIIKPEDQAFRDSDTEKSKIWHSPIENKVLVISVATYETDCYKRYVNSLKMFNINYKILGLNGNKYSMYSGGGGFKINILIDYLTNNKLDDDTILIVTDSFDVVFNDNIQNIINKYKKIVGSDTKEIDTDNKYRGKILFTAEPGCWPDSSLENEYPVVDTKYKYLNSGGYIGYYIDICKILNIGSNINKINELDDDQLYFTKKFLKDKSNIVLDYNCEIFQILCNVEEDISLNIDRSIVNNKYTNTQPSIIHGNGISKDFFNSMTNYIPNRWSSIYGYMEQVIDKSKVELPYIVIITNNINNVLNLKYDRDRIYFITFGSYNNIYTSKRVYYLKSQKNELSNRLKALEIIKGIQKYEKVDYVFFIDDTHVFNSYDILDLIKHDKEIIAPKLSKKDSLWSNFWGKIGHNGYYQRSDDYIDIVENKKRGVWAVPYIQNTFIFKIHIIDEIIKGYTQSQDMDMDMDMELCKYLRDNNYIMYIDNLVDYGYISDS